MESLPFPEMEEEWMRGRQRRGEGEELGGRREWKLQLGSKINI